MDTAILEQARLAKDARFDGRFFIAVKTTGIYCRPVCPVKPPKATNVRFYPTAAAAAEAGFRPCLRCRPEASPGTPAWAGTSTTVRRALRLINEGALDEGSIEQLSDRLGVTPRHLSRLFRQHLGASPKAIAQTRRLHFAKRLLDETELSMTEIALAAGYGSVRRFNDHFVKVYRRAPTVIRGHEVTGHVGGDAFSFKLPYRPPYAYEAVLEFLSIRGTPGIERVSEGCYERSVRVGDEVGRLKVTHEPDHYRLACEIRLGGSKGLMGAVERVRKLFDLNADPREVSACLMRDDTLAPWVAMNPGLRIPGAWDPFEVLVRAIVGQQVSVKGATTVMGVIARQFGEHLDGVHLFPAPESLATVKPGDLPMPGARAAAIAAAAGAVVRQEIDFDTHEPELLFDQLTAIKGIGPWTAQYVAMRAMNDPDAFLATDLVLRRVAAEHMGLVTDEALLARAETWRPWRAYAGMYLWSQANQRRKSS